MPTLPLSEAENIRRKQAVEAANGNIARAAASLGLARGTMSSWASEQAFLAGNGMPNFAPVIDRTPAEPIAVPDQFTAYEQIHAPKPRIRVKAWTQETPPEGPIYTILAIGDAHEKPGRDKERFKWFGRFATEHNPGCIVSIGDWASFDSLSTHEQPGSASDAARPAFHDELDSLDESLGLFHRDLPVGTIPVYQTHGNHEFRCERAANRQPKLNGDMPRRRDEIFSRYRWQTRPFGEHLNLYGIDFVHCPLSIMGKEMGGEHVERNVANKAMRSTVMGHTHRRNVVHLPKIGQRKITVVNLGTSMPFGLIEPYTGLAMTGWSYGLFLLRIQGGTILSEKFFDMVELEERYGD